MMILFDVLLTYGQSVKLEKASLVGYHNQRVYNEVDWPDSSVNLIKHIFGINELILF